MRRYVVSQDGVVHGWQVLDERGIAAQSGWVYASGAAARRGLREFLGGAEMDWRAADLWVRARDRSDWVELPREVRRLVRLIRMGA